MMILSFIAPSLLISWSLYFPLVRSLVCDGLVYGTPKIGDCEQALLQIPFARQADSSPQNRSPQLFVEPQFQSPPFNAIINNFRPQPIVQLPKIWKHSKSYVRNSTHAAFGISHPIREVG